METVRDINDDDQNWIDDQIEVGQKICSHYLSVNNAEITPQLLDTVFKLWKNDKSNDKSAAKTIAPGLGCLFGTYFVNKGQCKWVVVTDSFGTDLATESKTGYRTFPINVVWKRVDPKNLELSFFEPIWAVFIDTVNGKAPFQKPKL